MTPIEIYALSKYIANSGDSAEGIFEGGEFIKVQLGYMPSYSEDPQKERLLANNLVLDGKNYLIFNDIKLFEQDIDYTIALDFTPSLVNSGNASILSCFRDRDNKGLKIFSNGNENYPKAQYGPQGGISSINPSSLRTTELETHREICVIRHRKGQPGITLYRNDRYSLSEFDPIELKNPNANNTDEHYDSGNEVLAQQPLVIGGDYSTSGVTNLSKGTIHYAKIWFSDIGDAECKKICSWTYNEINFDYAGHNRYYYSNADGKCQFSFISQELLDELAMLYNSTSTIKTEGWKDTDLKTWMNTKLLNGVSILWKQILQPVSIKSIRNIKDGLGNGALREQIITSDNYFYLPSLAEVTGNNLNNVFLNELTSISEKTYINFADETQAVQDRIKRSKGQVCVWWLRSPYYSNQDSSSTLQYFNFVAKNGSAANRTGLNVTETDGNVWYSGTVNTNKYGICPCFSI